MTTGPEWRRTQRGWVKTTVATTLFTVVHSATATEAAKAAAARLVGRRARDAFYRPVYNLLAVVTSLALLLYVRRQPNRTLYHVRGAPAAIMRAVQGSALGYAAWAAWWVGPLRFSGLPGVVAWVLGRSHVPAPPEGQNPPPEEGLAPPAGPFRLSRHPLNLILVPLFGLNPKMTSNLAAFAAATSLYAWLGSLHTERRLRRAYGARYRGPAAPGAGEAPPPGRRPPSPHTAAGSVPVTATPSPLR